MIIDMTEGKPLHLLLKFSLPIMAGNLFQQLYNVIDTAIVGKLVGANALAAVGTTGNITFFFTTWIIGLYNGAGIIMAQYWGSRKHRDFMEVAASMISITAVLSSAIALIGFFLAPFLLHLIQVPENLMPMSLTYMRICLCFSIFSAIYNGCSVILRSVGDSRTPFTAMVVASIINIALDLVFVVCFNMGVAGVAIATVLSQLGSASVCLFHIFRHKEELHLNGILQVNSISKLLPICRIGIPTALQSCMISVGGMSVQGLVNSYGTDVMAAYTTAQRIDSVTIQVVVAFGSALSVFTGHNIGKQDFTRIRQGLRATLKLMMGASIALALIVLLGRYHLLSLFLNPETDAAAIEYGAEYLSIIGIAYMIAGVMNSYLNVCRGAGDVVTSVSAGLAELSGRILFAFLLSGPVGLGVFGIWLATPISWGCGCLIPVINYYRGTWKKLALTKPSSQKS